MYWKILGPSEGPTGTVRHCYTLYIQRIQKFEFGFEPVQNIILQFRMKQLENNFCYNPLEQGAGDITVKGPSKGIFSKTVKNIS